MTDEVRQRLFEPFFTTKGHGRGTGLGLAVVHGIVIQNHGAIHVDSQSGEGSVFTVWLPMVASAVDEPEPQAPPASTDAAGETVLIVEDEEAIRKLIRRVLERAGYRVLEAADAVEGTRQFHARAVDLIIADVGLPGMQGDQLAESLLRGAPDTRVLLLSGYTEADIGERVSDLGIVFLPKPFTPQDLLSAVAALLSRGRGHG